MNENFPNSSSHFWKYKPVFLQILHQSSVPSNITILYCFSSNITYFDQKEPIEAQIFETWECSDQNSPNSCHFWNNKLVFIQIVLHFSVSWDITHLHFFLRTFYILSTKGAYQKETCCFNHEEFCEFSLNHHHKSRNFTSIGLFCQEYMSFERKIYRGLIFYETEQWCKIWINPDPAVSKMAWGVGWTFIRALDSYCQKHMFQLENFRIITCHDTEGWCKILIKTISWLEKWHKEFC